MSDDLEPPRGLPGPLPAGERIVWQGSPKWTRLACQAFHVRAVAGYLAGLLAWRAATAVGAGESAAQAAAGAVSAAPLALAGLALLLGLAWVTARTTIYTLTNRRVVLRFGAALTKSINIPLSIVESGAVNAFADGAGDVAMTLKAPNKLAFLHLWPNVRPWRVAAPQPTLRAVPDAARVARLLATAMDAAVGVQVAQIESTVPGRRSAPAHGPAEAAAT